jgi:hypothetical protein
MYSVTIRNKTESMILLRVERDDAATRKRLKLGGYCLPQQKIQFLNTRLTDAFLTGVVHQFFFIVTILILLKRFCTVTQNHVFCIHSAIQFMTYSKISFYFFLFLYAFLN